MPDIIVLPSLPAIVAILDARFAPASLTLSRPFLIDFMARAPDALPLYLRVNLDPEAVPLRMPEWQDLRQIVRAALPSDEAAVLDEFNAIRPVRFAGSGSTALLATIDMDMRCRSGNSVQVDRIMLTRSTWKDLRPLAVLEYAVAMEAWKLQEKSTRKPRVG